MELTEPYVRAGFVSSSSMADNNDLFAEKRKLEQMVKKLFDNGGSNLGKDLRILKQSMKLDKLIVDEMMLCEFKEKK